MRQPLFLAMSFTFVAAVCLPVWAQPKPPTLTFRFVREGKRMFLSDGKAKVL
jgi:hypothetical protein